VSALRQPCKPFQLKRRANAGMPHWLCQAAPCWPNAGLQFALAMGVLTIFISVNTPVLKMADRWASRASLKRRAAEEMVPCDRCDAMVPFDVYAEHKCLVRAPASAQLAALRRPTEGLPEAGSRIPCEACSAVVTAAEYDSHVAIHFQQHQSTPLRLRAADDEALAEELQRAEGLRGSGSAYERQAEDALQRSLSRKRISLEEFHQRKEALGSVLQAPDPHGFPGELSQPAFGRCEFELCTCAHACSTRRADPRDSTSATEQRQQDLLV
jgi:hypothetical protein